MGIFISKVPPRDLKTNITFSVPDSLDSFGLRQCQEAEVTGLVVDVIDTADPSFLTNEYAGLSSGSQGVGYCRSDVQLLVRENPSVVTTVVSDILEVVAKHGAIRLLRIHGHGLPGYQSVWGGALYAVITSPSQETSEELIYNNVQNPHSQTGIGNWNLAMLTGQLMRLCPHFGPKAEVWLMGCTVAAEPVGQQFISRLSGILGVPVVAAVPLQYGTDRLQSALKSANFLHEGEIRNGSPTLNPFAKK